MTQNKNEIRRESESLDLPKIERQRLIAERYRRDLIRHSKAELLGWHLAIAQEQLARLNPILLDVDSRPMLLRDYVEGNCYISTRVVVDGLVELLESQVIEADALTFAAVRYLVLQMNHAESSVGVRLADSIHALLMLILLLLACHADSSRLPTDSPYFSRTLRIVGLPEFSGSNCTELLTQLLSEAE